MMPMRKFIEATKGWLGISQSAQAPLEARAEFLLKYGNLLIGTLSVRDGVWKFEYSDEFRRNGSLRPIVEFPDVDKTYESSDLWQFFASRIPSPERPEVGEILRREQIAEDDAVGLLKRFGKQTIVNPFRLEAAV